MLEKEADCAMKPLRYSSLMMSQLLEFEQLPFLDTINATK